MRGPARLRAIYLELRAATRGQVPAGDLLRLAHLILRSYTADRDGLSDFGRPSDSRAFFALPLDIAMRDGGWRILNFEVCRAFGIDEIEPENLTILRVCIQGFLGPQWQQQIRED